MPWSGGTFSRSNGANGWQNDASALIGITADRHDALDNDLATGINNCLTKDGQNAPTANLPMGSFRHTGVSDATANDQYIAYGQSRNMFERVEAKELGSYTVSNTVVDTVMGTLVIPANTLTATRGFRAKMIGEAYNNVGAGSGSTLKFKVNGTSTLEGIIPSIASTNYRPYKFEVDGHYDGSTIVLLGRLVYATAAIAPSSPPMTSSTELIQMNFNAAAVGSNITLTFTVQHDVANASLAMNRRVVVLEIL